MLVTNQTPQDFWFGPLHLLGGVGQTLTVDDTTATSLYLRDDAVADAINNLYASGNIAVSGAAAPFPRPTGVPQVIHGGGSPQGMQFAPQGSLYLRRDGGGSNNLYVKTTGVTVDTGWSQVGAPDPWSGLNSTLGLLASTFPIHMANGSVAPSASTAHGCGVWLDAGTIVTGLVLNVVSAATGLTVAYVGIYNSSYIRQAVSANATSAFGAVGWVKVPLASTYTVPISGLYYFANIFAGTTNPTITVISGAGSQASQANPSGQYPYFSGAGTDSTLIATASPTTTNQAQWMGAY